jgi:hypothetical protein
MAVGWLVELMPKRDFVAALVEGWNDRAQIRTRTTNVTVTPVQNGNSHLFEFSVLSRQLSVICA